MNWYFHSLEGVRQIFRCFSVRTPTLRSSQERPISVCVLFRGWVSFRGSVRELECWFATAEVEVEQEFDAVQATCPTIVLPAMDVVHEH